MKDRDAIRSRFVHPDPGAMVAGTLRIDCSALTPMVAMPGDPRNGRPISALSEPIAIDIAYGGSCTGGKRADMDMYARVLERGLDADLTVADGVELWLQFGSDAIRRYAQSMGYIDLFTRAGARMLPPSCGACINAGPGVSVHPDQVSISAINRNYPGRSGPGRVYLGSPAVVAASALLGRIAAPSEVCRAARN